MNGQQNPDGAVLLPWRERLDDLIRYGPTFRRRRDVLVELRRADVPEAMIDRFMGEAEVWGGDPQEAPQRLGT